MANCLIGFPNRIDAGVLSGGSYLPSLPLSNLQVRTLGILARTTDLNLASTQFNLNLTSSSSVQIFALCNHNISLYGKFRLRCGADPGFATSLFDSGWSSVWPVVYPYGTLPWEDPRWWTGKAGPEQIQGQYATLVVILPQTFLAQYWRLEIDDGSNDSGCIQAGRVFLGPAWQPSKNMSYGAGIGWSTKTDVQEALGGAEFFGRRVPRRMATMTLDNITEDEGMTQAFDIDRQAGVDKEVFWVHDPEDTVHAQRRQFIARFDTLNPVQFPVFNTTTKAYSFKELL